MKTIDKTDPKYRLNKIEKIYTGIQIIFICIATFVFVLGIFVYDKIFNKNEVDNISNHLNNFEL